jgi:prolyl oligopeptidase PreP (S9A serine peptidase family)
MSVNSLGMEARISTRRHFLAGTAGTALQRAQRGPAPILIRIGASADHGSGKPTSMRIAEDADVLTFLAKALGM